MRRHRDREWYSAVLAVAGLLWRRGLLRVVQDTAMICAVLLRARSGLLAVSHVSTM